MYLFLELFFLDTPFYHLHSSTHSLASLHLYLVRLQPNCSTKLYLAIGQSLPEPGFLVSFYTADMYDFLTNSSLAWGREERWTARGL